MAIQYTGGVRNAAIRTISGYDRDGYFREVVREELPVLGLRGYSVEHNGRVVYRWSR